MIARVGLLACIAWALACASPPSPVDAARSFLIVRVLVPADGLPREVQRAGFALPVDPRSKRRIVEVTRDLFALEKLPMNPAIDRILDQIEATQIPEPAI